MNLAKKICFVVLIISLPCSSFGWGVLGHRVVGQIADNYLTAKARAAIRHILGSESIAIASTWPDFIKSDSTYAYTFNWHFVDLDSGLTTEQARDFFKHDTAADLYTKTIFLIHELKKKNLSIEKKRMDLKLLIHFVGDIHQPFHV